MAYKLQTALGQAIYGARKCTVEPVIGIIKEVFGFRQFSLRGNPRRQANGVWSVWPSISSASILYSGPNLESDGMLPARLRASLSTMFCL